VRCIEAGSTLDARPSLVRSGRCDGTVPVKECVRSQYIFIRQSDRHRYKFSSEMCPAVVPFRLSKGTSSNWLCVQKCRVSCSIAKVMRDVKRFVQGF